jgi:NAD(P)-dependent dehydrogenase (short-subunit alcohol dehydrogenase family)
MQVGSRLENSSQRRQRLSSPIPTISTGILPVELSLISLLTTPNSKGGFYFSQAILPCLLKGADQSPKHPPTLLFTGATASLRNSAFFSSFAVGKFATRALVQSLAREFGPKGVHAGHVIIDGVIDLLESKEYLKDAGPDAKISPASVSDECAVVGERC